MIVERTPVQSGWPLLLEYREIRENKDPLSHPLHYGLTFQQRFSGSRRSPASESLASVTNHEW